MWPGPILLFALFCGCSCRVPSERRAPETRDRLPVAPDHDCRLRGQPGGRRSLPSPKVGRLRHRDERRPRRRRRPLDPGATGDAPPRRLRQGRRPRRDMQEASRTTTATSRRPRFNVSTRRARSAPCYVFRPATAIPTAAGLIPWALVFMVMNHKAVTRMGLCPAAWFTTLSGKQLTPVHPYWFDEHNCTADPKFDVPGTVPLFSTHSEARGLRGTPESGRLVADPRAPARRRRGRLDLTDRSCGTKLFRVGADLGPPGRAPDHPRARPETHDDADHGEGHPVVRRRPSAADRRGTTTASRMHGRWA